MGEQQTNSEEPSELQRRLARPVLQQPGTPYDWEIDELHDAVQRHPSAPKSPKPTVDSTNETPDPAA